MSNAERQTCELEVERDNRFSEEKLMAKAGGYAFGWDNCSDRDRQVAKALAAVATKVGLGQYTVEDIFLGADPNKPSGFKISDKKHAFLDSFWQMKDDVDERLGKYSNKTVSRLRLYTAVGLAIKDKMSGALAKKVERERANMFDDDWD
jgi:hypothetical protein